MDESQPFLYITPDRQFFSEEAQYVAWADFSFLCGPVDTMPVQHFNISQYEIELFYRCMEYCTAVNFKMCPLRKVILLKYMSFIKIREREKDTSPGCLGFSFTVLAKKSWSHLLCRVDF